VEQSIRAVVVVAAEVVEVQEIKAALAAMVPQGY
jgi:hypothetical protein